jgi:hypothetical protein
MLVLPLGVVQILIALWVRRQTGSGPLRRVLLTTMAALAAALAVGIFVDEGPLRMLMILIYFVPGIPTFLFLVRKRMWALALLLFVIPPAPLVLLPR